MGWDRCLGFRVLGAIQVWGCWGLGSGYTGTVVSKGTGKEKPTAAGWGGGGGQCPSTMFDDVASRPRVSGLGFTAQV